MNQDSRVEMSIESLAITETINSIDLTLCFSYIFATLGRKLNQSSCSNIKAYSDAAEIQCIH